MPHRLEGGSAQEGRLQGLVLPRLRQKRDLCERKRPHRSCGTRSTTSLCSTLCRRIWMIDRAGALVGYLFLEIPVLQLRIHGGIDAGHRGLLICRKQQFT